MRKREGLRKLLPLVEPHLIAKGEQARQMIRFIQLRDSHWYGHPLTPSELEVCQSVAILNRKGI